MMGRQETNIHQIIIIHRRKMSCDCSFEVKHSKLFSAKQNSVVSDVWARLSHSSDGQGINLSQTLILVKKTCTIDKLIVCPV